MRFLVLALLCMTACGSKPDNGAPSNSKTLWSHWTGDLDLDLRQGEFQHTFYMQFHFDPQSNCHSDVYAVGDQDSGTFQVSGSYYVIGGSGDPGCAALDGTYTYQKNGDALSISGNGNTYELQ